MQTRIFLLLGLVTQTRAFQLHKPICVPSRTVFDEHLELGDGSRIRPDKCLIESARLYSSNDANSNQPRNPRRPRLPNPFKAIRSATTKLVQTVLRFRARFLALTPKAKRLTIVKFLLIFLLSSTVTNRVVSQNSAPRPIEISYSSFLDLVERQAVDSNNNIPKIDQVRIGTDRIIYRLQRTTESSNGRSAEKYDPFSSNGRTSKQETPPATRSARKQRQQSSYVQAYTRKVSASPEFVQKLRAHDIPFSAAAAPPASIVALTVRSFFVVFYLLIMFRMYKAMSRNMGGDKSDSPGKLADDGNLSRATFDEIQGIDNAKLEVMELVDVLRNPEKYAILGARAPTGLLLVGPPGTLDHTGSRTLVVDMCD
jgi:ATP-dependent Zn protease